MYTSLPYPYFSYTLAAYVKDIGKRIKIAQIPNQYRYACTYKTYFEFKFDMTSQDLAMESEMLISFYSMSSGYNNEWKTIKKKLEKNWECDIS